MNIKRGFQQGLVILAVFFYLDLIGIPAFIGESVLVFFAALVGLFALSFVRREHRKEPKSILQVLVYSLTIGVVSGVGFALVTFFFARLQGQGIRVNEVFAEIKPESTALLTGMSVADIRGGASVLQGLIKMVLYFAGGGIIGGLSVFLFSGKGGLLQSETGAKVKNWSTVGLPFLFYALFVLNRQVALPFFSTEGARGNFGLTIIFLFVGSALFSLRAMKPGRQKLIVVLLILLLVIVLPQLANTLQNAVLGAVMIFIVMGIGLNIVVGYAGLLDLGYVAFFAVGAYTYGLLSSPGSYVLVNLPWFEGVNFWVGLPIAFLIGAFTGVLLGTPVLKLRGDCDPGFW